MYKTIRLTIAYSLLVFCCGCTSVADKNNSDPIDIFQDKIGQGQYFEAFIYWPSAEVEYRKVPEGAVGQAFDMLISRTAAVGTDDWVNIFTNKQIDNDLKRALFEEILEGDEWADIHYGE